METDFFELDFCIDVDMPLCHYVDAGVHKSPFHINSQDFCLPLANRFPENVEPVSNL